MDERITSPVSGSSSHNLGMPMAQTRDTVPRRDAELGTEPVLPATMLDRGLENALLDLVTGVDRDV